MEKQFFVSREFLAELEAAYAADSICIKGTIAQLVTYQGRAYCVTGVRSLGAKTEDVEAYLVAEYNNYTSGPPPLAYAHHRVNPKYLGYTAMLCSYQGRRVVLTDAVLFKEAPAGPVQASLF